MIRLARQEDLKQVVQIYEDVLTREEETVSYTNWRKNLYPTLEYAQEALEKNTLFVGEENGIYGSVVLNHIQPKEYEQIPWLTEVTNPEDVIVIHTLCLHPDAMGQGKGREFMKFCEEYAAEQGAKVIRLDTYEGNLPAAAMYTKLGYTYVGSTKFHFQGVIWEVLKCFEKAISF